MSDPGFDRLRPRVGHRRAQRRTTTAEGARPPDPQGRRALFSTPEQQAVPGVVTVTCSDCEQVTPCSPLTLVTLALPSVHLPLLRSYPSWMRCPACHRRTWVRLGLRR